MSSPALPAKGFASFREFYPYYLSEHAHPTSRRLHFLGTTLFLGQFIAAFVTGNAWLWLTGPVSAYALAWLGHFGFEKNRPATFRHPFYSLIGDFAMFGDILRGRIRW
jgi:hypothetical protein